MADELPLPREIPWRLASTTQPRVDGAPNGTSLSLFFYEPDDELVEHAAADERLVYLKLTASISPAAFPTERSKLAASFLGEGVPCFHVLLDLHVRNPAGAAGDVRPYFHAAEPLHRRMIQTGVVGAEAFEGESDGQFMGKSGSQMYETQSTKSKTLSAGGGASFGIGGFSIGGSVRSTTTDVTSDRSVAQVVDTTVREASEERRELVSHQTRVENVLTLLSAKNLGTPYLTFSLAPQPLQLLSIDPSDPNLWLQQLLARRSSGIEGIQEFTAVAVVPRGDDFCVDARLRRVCLLDSPPGPLSFDERLRLEPALDLLQLARMVDYLYALYPPGTPLDELDVDLVSGLQDAGDFRRPVVEGWALRLMPLVVEALIASPHSSPGVGKRGSANYKHFLELWLETLRDEYEREAARSPLERGVLLGEDRLLRTCFSGGDEGVAVTSSDVSVSPLVRVPIDRGALDVGGVRGVADAGRATVRTRAFETVTRWNALESRLANLVERRQALPQEPVSVADPAVFGVLVDRWAKLDPGDERNLGFDEAAKLLGLGDAERKRLRALGANDLRGIARALRAAPTLERHDEEVRRFAQPSEGRQEAESPPEPLGFDLSAADAAALEQSLAESAARAGGDGAAP